MESAVHPAEIMLSLKNAFSLLALGLVACSSSSSREPFPLEEDNSVKVPPFSDDSPPVEAKSQTPSPDKVAAAPDVTKDEPAPPPECPTEAEPNNDPDKASSFTRCITGELTGWTDNDYLKIVAPKDVTDMIIDHMDPQGGIQYTVTTPQGGGGAGGSSSFNMSFTDQAPKTKVKPGQAYLFSLKWDNNGAGAVTDKRTYMMRVTFE